MPPEGLQKVILLTGSNLGNRSGNLEKAISMIRTSVGQVQKQSSLFESAPWGNTHQPAFVNQGLVVLTSLKPLELLAALQIIEEKMGRVRMVKWEARIIDIDILFYGSQVVNEPVLTIPHPALANRRFALEPLVEIIPSFKHPILNVSVKQLLVQCNDKGEVVKQEKYVS